MQKFTRIHFSRYVNSCKHYGICMQVENTWSTVYVFQIFSKITNWWTDFSLYFIRVHLNIHVYLMKKYIELCVQNYGLECIMFFNSNSTLVCLLFNIPPNNVLVIWIQHCMAAIFNNSHNTYSLWKRWE